MELLVHSKASVNQHDRQGLTPLFTAVMNQNVPAVTFLLKQGANVGRHYQLRPLLKVSIRQHYFSCLYCVSSMNVFTKRMGPCL